MRIILFLMLIISSTYAVEEKCFSSKKECCDYCYAEFDRMMQAAGFDHLSVEEDAGSYVAEIRYKTDKCINHCRSLFD